jgi:glycolate oxidase iron-sulfur subunit
MTSKVEAPPLATRIDDLLTCVHCGFCLPACPTYELLGNECDSPRGRLYLMRAVAEGRLEAGDRSFALHIDQCLGCRACEPVCPSGVRYGNLLEHARHTRSEAGTLTDRVARLVLRLIFANRWLGSIFWAALRLLRASGLPLVIARAGRPGKMPGPLRFATAMLAATAPRLSGELRAIRWRRRRARMSVWRSGAGRSGPPDGELVALLEGCVMSGLFGYVNRATERLVHAHGAPTARLPGGLCCGALHAHAGDLKTARRLARRVIVAFESSRAEHLLTNSAGCGAAMKEYGDWLSDDPDFSARAERVAHRVRDACEWLAGRPSPEFRSMRAQMGYDAPCHLLHAQRINEAPLELLSRVPSLEVEELPRSDRCCGGAGMYGLTRRRLSEDLLTRKLYEALDLGVRTLATGNPGCLMQIGAGALVHRLPLQAIHPVELLDGLVESGSSGTS